MEKKIEERQREDLSHIEMDRIKSGIPRFDELVDGGLLRERAYLISGPTGSGKTTFAMQLIYNGVTRFGEPGVYVTFEISPEQLRRDMSSVNMEVKRLEDEERLVLIDASSAKVGLGTHEKFVVPRPITLDAVMFEIYNCIQRMGAKRVVIDSLDALELHARDEEEFRIYMLKLISIIKSFQCTLFLITEAPQRDRASRNGVVEFVADGIIRLYYTLRDNKRTRRLEILKARGIPHSSTVNTFTISKNGIEIQPEADIDRLIEKERMRIR